MEESVLKVKDKKPLEYDKQYTATAVINNFCNPGDVVTLIKPFVTLGNDTDVVLQNSVGKRVIASESTFKLLVEVTKPQISKEK